MGDDYLYRAKQLAASTKVKNAKYLQTLDVPPDLEDKFHSLLVNKTNLEADLVSFHQKQMILEELEKPVEEMLTEEKIEGEIAKWTGNLSEAKAVHLQNLTKMEATKKLLLEALDCLNVSVRELSQKITMLEDKYASIGFDSQEGGRFDKGKINPLANKIAKERILSLLKNAEEEKQLLQERASRLESLRQLADNTVACVDSQAESQLKLSKLQDKVSRLELLCGIKCTIIDDQTVTIQYIDPDSQRLPEDSKLVITLSFALDENQSLELSKVDTNLKINEVESVIQSAKNDKDLPKLIRSLRKSWLSHVPLLAEISSLRERHAIDWKAEERALHLIPTKYIVCRLSIPTTYPHGGGSVTLEQIMGGTNGLTEESISPPEDKSLTGWVTHLENMLGKTKSDFS